MSSGLYAWSARIRSCFGEAPRDLGRQAGPCVVRYFLQVQSASLGQEHSGFLSPGLHVQSACFLHAHAVDISLDLQAASPLQAHLRPDVLQPVKNTDKANISAMINNRLISLLLVPVSYEPCVTPPGRQSSAGPGL